MMFDFLKPININEKIAQYKKTKDAVLLDVRTIEEYKDGHVENSVNIPVEQIIKIKSVAPNTNAHIFVYCHSGARATNAVHSLKKMGYTNVINSGGIIHYNEKVVK